MDDFDPYHLDDDDAIYEDYEEFERKYLEYVHRTKYDGCGNKYFLKLIDKKIEKIELLEERIKILSNNITELEQKIKALEASFKPTIEYQIQLTEYKEKLKELNEDLINMKEIKESMWNRENEEIEVLLN